jgi:hypothetical protein
VIYDIRQCHMAVSWNMSSHISQLWNIPLTLSQKSIPCIIIYLTLSCRYLSQSIQCFTAIIGIYIVRYKLGNFGDEVPPCLRAKQFSRPGEAPFGHHSNHTYSTLSDNIHHNSVLVMQQKQELHELLTVLSVGDLTMHSH